MVRIHGRVLHTEIIKEEVKASLLIICKFQKSVSVLAVKIVKGPYGFVGVHRTDTILHYLYQAKVQFRTKKIQRISVLVSHT